MLSGIKRYWKLHKEKADLHPKKLAKKTTFCSILSENYTNSKVFFTWIWRVLVSVLEPNMVVIMDNNTSFYKSLKIKDLIESVWTELIMYLPKYSPDLNPIKKCWWPLKIQIHKTRKFCNNFDEIMTYIFWKNSC